MRTGTKYKAISSLIVLQCVSWVTVFESKAWFDRTLTVNSVFLFFNFWSWLYIIITPGYTLMHIPSPPYQANKWNLWRLSPWGWILKKPFRWFCSEASYGNHHPRVYRTGVRAGNGPFTSDLDVSISKGNSDLCSFMERQILSLTIGIWIYQSTWRV